MAATSMCRRDLPARQAAEACFVDNAAAAAPVTTLIAPQNYHDAPNYFLIISGASMTDHRGWIAPNLKPVKSTAITSDSLAT